MILFFRGHDRAVVISAMWSIWSSRNNIVHGSEQYFPEQIVHVIEEMISTLEMPPKEVQPV